MNTASPQQHQAALAIDNAPVAISMEWNPRSATAAGWLALWQALPGLAAPQVIVGIGAPLAAANGIRIPGLHALERLSRGRVTLPATPYALWTLVYGVDPTAAFDEADRLFKLLDPVARLRESNSLFSYRHGRDLTGYKDGSANPKGEEAWRAALLGEGPWAGASFALVQRWLHFRRRFAAVASEARDLTIGRRLVDDEEIDDAPASAHVKRTAQEEFDPPAFMLRRSMPWGDARRNGLQFIALVNDLGKTDAMLRRMAGLEDGITDALLTHSQAETGAYYFLPPVTATGLKLPEAVPVVAPAAAGGVSPQAEAPVPQSIIRLTKNGPLALEGNFAIGGQPQARALLCRCGASATQPYCDGSHATLGTAGFVAGDPDCAVDEVVAPKNAGRVAIETMADGPLLVHGSVELCTDDGRHISGSAQPTLCRCGHSANKPFCDGSHARIGFRSRD